MRIRIEYNKYEHSPSATSWSHMAGTLSASGILWIALLYFVLENIQVLFFGDRITAISIIGAIVCFFAIIAFFKRKERECAIFDAMRVELGRDLTDEEKKNIRKRLKQKKKKD